MELRPFNTRAVGTARSPGTSPSLAASHARVAEVLPFEAGPPLELPLYAVAVRAGFPSPADDHVDRLLDLNELCVARPAATYFVRSEGDSMVRHGILDGDVLVVDRSLDPGDGDIVVAALNGELLVKRLQVWGRNGSRRVVLESGSADFPDVEVLEGHELCVWGVVTSAVHRFRR